MFFRKTASLAFLVLTSACAVKQPEKFAQGQGIGLESLQTYQGKTYSLHTGRKVTTLNHSRFENVLISKDLESSGIDSFGLVEYSTEAKLLGPDYPFVGRENADYEIRLEVTAKALRLYKVATRELLPYTELTALRPEDHLSDGRLKVLLLSYDLKGLYRIEKRLNPNGEPTNEWLEIPESDLNSATHLRIDYETRQIPETLLKTDLFPKDLLGNPDDLWYFSETVIDTSVGMEELIGDSDSNHDMNFHPAKLVRILPLEKSLRAVNVARAAEIDTKNAINVIRDLILEIPVERKAFRFKKSVASADLREELDEKVAPMDRPYMEIKFAEMIETKNPDDAPKGDDLRGSGQKIKLADLELSRDYLGFTVLKIEEGTRVRYNFLKVGSREYDRRMSHSSDRSKHFGFISQTEPTLDNWKTIYKKDQKHEFIVRHNPRKKSIVYHFSTKTPTDPKIRALGRKAVLGWNLALQEAQSGMEMVLDETRDVSMGDLRFNVIDIIVTEGENNGLIGFGPSMYDPNTGEIISSSANLHFNAIRPSLVSRLREYIRENSGVNETRHLPIAKWAMPKSESYIEKQIATRCTGTDSTVGDLGHYVEALHQQNQGRGPGWRHSVLDSGDISVIEDCLDHLLPEYAVQALMHEIGHTLGLRHNFKGSNDVANQNGKTSSSVMDYLAWEAPPMDRPGLYDVAALRFAYGGEVQTLDGRWMRVDPEKSLEQQFGTNLKNYKFCTDEDLLAANDPLCRQFDLGRNPVEVARFLLMRADQNYLKLYFRNDKAKMYDSTNVFKAVADDLGELQKFYIEGRNQMVLAGWVAPNQQYFEGWDEATFAKIESQIGLPSTVDIPDEISLEKLRHYRAAGKIFIDAMESLMFMPNRTCHLEDQVTGVTLHLEFEALRARIFQETKGMIAIRSCQDLNTETVTHLRSTGEEGYLLNDLRYSMSDQDLNEPFDILGVNTLRKFASAVLTTRVNSADKNIDKKFFPAPLDEPQVRNQLLSALLDRAMFGMKVRTGDVLPVFSAESDLVLGFFKDFGTKENQGVLLKDNLAESRRRIGTLVARKTDRIALGASSLSDLNALEVGTDALLVVDAQKNPAAQELVNQIKKIRLQNLHSSAEILAQENLLLRILDLYAN